MILYWSGTQFFYLIDIYLAFIFYILFIFLTVFLFLGFVPITSESKLVAVKGPVPWQISLNCEKATLPVAFTSPATHFKPIILQQNANITKLVHPKAE